MTRKHKKVSDTVYRYYQDTDQKIEFRRKGMEWPEFRPMMVADPRTLLEVTANAELKMQGGAFHPVPEHMIGLVPEF